MKSLISIFLIFTGASVFAASDVYFVKSISGSCEKKGKVEGKFGKEIYEDWAIWNPVLVLKTPDAMDSILRKAQSLGANRVIIEGLDGEYLKTYTKTHGDYASKSHTTLETMTVRGVAYACK